MRRQELVIEAIIPPEKQERKLLVIESFNVTRKEFRVDQRLGIKIEISVEQFETLDCCEYHGPSGASALVHRFRHRLPWQRMADGCTMAHGRGYGQGCRRNFRQDEWK